MHKIVKITPPIVQFSHLVALFNHQAGPPIGKMTHTVGISNIHTVKPCKKSSPSSHRAPHWPTNTPIFALFPPLKMVVVDQQGAPVEGAKINFYPVFAYSGAVAEQAIFEGTTNAEGCYDFGEVNPFYKPGTSDNITNHLVEIVYEGKKYYDWMPMHEAQTVGCKDINDTYVKKLTLK